LTDAEPALEVLIVLRDEDRHAGIVILRGPSLLPEVSWHEVRNSRGVGSIPERDDRLTTPYSINCGIPIVFADYRLKLAYSGERQNL
jgi:hypothetical protein